MNDSPESHASDLSARARNIAAGARSLPEPLRPRFVESACGGDPPLRAEVEHLLGWRPEAVPPRRVDPVVERSIEEALEERPPERPADLERPERPADFARPERSAEPVRPAEAARAARPAPEARPRRRPPYILLFATAVLIWLCFILLQQSRRADEAGAARDRAAMEAGAARSALDEAQGELNTTRQVSERLATLLTTEGPETTWRDRVAVWRLLDRGTELVGADSSLGPEARARLYDALAEAYRAHRLPGRADSLSERARLVRGGAPAAPADVP